MPAPLDFLASCRMVLLLPIGDGSDLLRLEIHGIAIVGLGDDGPTKRKQDGGIFGSMA